MLTITLVTPVWNDSQRFGEFGPKLARMLAESSLKVRWIVADDGSAPDEQARITELVDSLKRIYPDVEAMLFEQRSYKGGAIYSAWDSTPDAEWLAFVDADGAIAPEAIVELMVHAVARGANFACIGVRQHSEETPLQRRFLRAISFRAFGFIVRRLLGIQFLDTQCGAKVVSAPAYRNVSGRLEERGYIADVELLVALDRQGVVVEEVRIPWREMPGSKVSLVGDTLPMLQGVLRIRKRLRQGHYS